MMSHYAKIRYDETGAEYEGEWNKDGKRHGKGVLLLSNGVSYKGEFVNGHFQGSGELSFPDGSLYQGQFSVSMFSGYGVHRNNEGMVYEGQFKEGQPKGLGLVTFPDGSNGTPHCEGVFNGELCERRCDANEAVKKARQIQTLVRAIVTYQVK